MPGDLLTTILPPIETQIPEACKLDEVALLKVPELVYSSTLALDRDNFAQGINPKKTKKVFTVKDRYIWTDKKGEMVGIEDPDGKMAQQEMTLTKRPIILWDGESGNGWSYKLEILHLQRSRQSTTITLDGPNVLEAERGDWSLRIQNGEGEEGKFIRIVQTTKREPEGEESESDVGEEEKIWNTNLAASPKTIGDLKGFGDKEPLELFNDIFAFVQTSEEFKTRVKNQAQGL